MSRFALIVIPPSAIREEGRTIPALGPKHAAIGFSAMRPIECQWDNSSIGVVIKSGLNPFMSEIQFGRGATQVSNRAPEWRWAS